MRLSPTVTLALALAAGVAGTAAAQSTASPSGMPSQQTGASAQPSSSGMQPQTNSGYQTPAQQTPNSYSQTQPNAGNTSSYSQTQPSTGMTQQPGQMQANTSAMPPGSSAPGMDTRQSPNLRAAVQAQPNSDQSVMQAQQRLQAAGLYKGPVDGTMDPDTRAAIARFQEQNGLRRTERLDEATLARLNSGSQMEKSGSSAVAAPSPASSAANQSTQPMPEGAGNSGPAAQQPPPR